MSAGGGPARRRRRRPPEPGEFEDPLSNYDPRPCADELERSLCEDAVTVIETRPFTHVRPEMTVREALRRMADLNIACLVVTEDDRPVGIFSERDVLMRVAECYAELADRPVREVMTPNPVVVYESDTPARALNLMGGGMFRHVPVVDVDGKLIGIIGARRVTAYLRQRVGDSAGGAG